jgi:hypothetical protein
VPLESISSAAQLAVFHSRIAHQVVADGVGNWSEHAGFPVPSPTAGVRDRGLPA